MINEDDDVAEEADGSSCSESVRRRRSRPDGVSSGGEPVASGVIASAAVASAAVAAVGVLSWTLIRGTDS